MAAAVVALLPLTSAAQIVTDGSVGSAGRVDFGSGTAVIPDTAGEVRGKNLFHSFDRFHVNEGRAALFTSSRPGLENVIGRVTGGEASRIEGDLVSLVPNADLWLVNPAGVLFGPNSRVGVDGALHVSTADEVRFSDGTAWGARAPRPGPLTVAEPRAFGFLGGPPGRIEVRGSRLGFDATDPSEPPTVRGPISLVGGDVVVSAAPGAPGPARVESYRGSLHLAARHSLGEIVPGQASAAPPGDGSVLVAAASLAAVADARDEGLILEAGRLELSGVDGFVVSIGPAPGAAFRLRGREVAIDGSRLATTTFAARPGPDLAIEAGALRIGGGSALQTRTDGPGRGGDVRIAATGAVSLDGGSLVVAGAPATTLAGAPSDADGGSVRVVAGDLAIEGAGALGSLTEGGGRGGDVTVRVAGTVALGSGGRIEARSAGPGAAGSVRLAAAEVAVRDGAAVAVLSDLAGPSGTLAIDAGGTLAIAGGEVATFAGGAGGRLRLTAGRNVEVVNGGAVTVQGFDSPDARATIAAGERVVLADESDAVAAASGGRLPAGAALFEVAAPEVSLGGGSTLSVVTDVARGPARGLVVRAEGLTLNDGAIFSLGSGAAKGPSVEAEARTVGLSGGSFLFTQTAGAADAGDLKVTAGEVGLAGGSALGSFPAGLFVPELATPAALGGEPPSGGAGAVEVVAARLSLTGDSGIITSTSGAGDAGPVLIRADDVSLDSSFVATATAGSGRGGDVAIHAGELRLAGSVISTGTNRPEGIGPDGTAGAAGNVLVTAGRVLLVDGSSINAGTVSSQGGGSIRIEGGSLTVGRPGDAEPSGIISASGNLDVVGGPLGAGGDIGIEVDDLTLADGVIATSTFGAGRAGRVRVDAGRVVADLEGGIDSSTAGAGAAGSVEVRARGEVVLRGGAVIQSTSEGSGDAGTVRVEAGRLVDVAGFGTSGGVRTPSAISSAVGPGEEGGPLPPGARPRGGSVTVAASEVRLADGGQVSASNLRRGEAGSIRIEAPDRLTLDRASVATAAVDGGGGRIEIRAGRLVRLGPDSVVASSVTGDATTTAGDIDVDPRFLILDEGSAIRANATTGRGGNIRIVADHIITDATAAIDASAGPAGIDGTVVTSTPAENLSSNLRVDPAVFLGADRRLGESCAANRASGPSSFGPARRGGLPPGPDRPAPAFYDLAEADGAAKAGGGGGLRLRPCGAAGG